MGGFNSITQIFMNIKDLLFIKIATRFIREYDYSKAFIIYKLYIFVINSVSSIKISIIDSNTTLFFKKYNSGYLAFIHIVFTYLQCKFSNILYTFIFFPKYLVHTQFLELIVKNLVITCMAVCIITWLEARTSPAYSS